MFQFTGLAARRLWIQRRLIREPQDQSSFVNSPGLIADFHALHRLLMPRHPPCALSSLTTYIQNSHTPARTGIAPQPPLGRKARIKRHLLKSNDFLSPMRLLRTSRPADRSASTRCTHTKMPTTFYNQIVKDHPASAGCSNEQEPSLFRRHASRSSAAFNRRARKYMHPSQGRQWPP